MTQSELNKRKYVEHRANVKLDNAAAFKEQFIDGVRTSFAETLQFSENAFYHAAEEYVWTWVRNEIQNGANLETLEDRAMVAMIATSRTGWTSTSPVANLMKDYRRAAYVELYEMLHDLNCPTDEEVSAAYAPPYMQKPDKESGAYAIVSTEWDMALGKLVSVQCSHCGQFQGGLEGLVSNSVAFQHTCLNCTGTMVVDMRYADTTPHIQTPQDRRGDES